jgi:hypothetical protein
MRHFFKVADRAWRETWRLVVHKNPKALIIALFIFLLTVFMTYRWEGWNNMSALIIGSGIVSLATFSIFVLILLFNCFLFTPKALCEGLQRKLDAANNDKKLLEEKFLEIERNRITFSLESYRRGAEVFDSNNINEGIKAFYLKVTNLHPSNTAEDVVVLITEIAPKENFYGADFIPLSYRLPLWIHPSETLQESRSCNINPGASQYFALACLGMEDNTFYRAVLAPFTLSDDYLEAIHVSDYGFQTFEPEAKNPPVQLKLLITAKNIKREFIAELYIPHESEKLSEAYLRIFDFDAPPHAEGTKPLS